MKDYMTPAERLAPHRQLGNGEFMLMLIFLLTLMLGAITLAQYIDDRAAEIETAQLIKWHRQSLNCGI